MPKLPTSPSYTLRRLIGRVVGRDLDGRLARALIVQFGHARKAVLVTRAFGLRWVVFRLGYALRLRSGIIRRQSPVATWDKAPFPAELSHPSLAQPERYLAYRRDVPARFFFVSSQITTVDARLKEWDAAGGGPVASADALLHGIFRYFSSADRDLGFPPDWHLNPWNKQRMPRQVHWSRIDEHGHGDIKLVWEPSRFTFAYDLVRAYRRTNDVRYAEAFWRLVEDWRQHNPPNTGANWRCGQETSFRIMAWCFGLHGFLDAEATTPERVAMLVQAIAAAGRRIEANLSYGVSQRNNHGVSEATGLWTIGLLFPELRRAAHWRALGVKHLEALGRELIYDDGAFAQHSINYHRVMLHDYLWALRLGDLNGHPLSAELRRRVGSAAELLYQLQDADSGQAPFYGQNDGALILPLNNCNFHDLRPVIGAVCYLISGRRRYAAGPWDEDLVWLFGREALDGPLAAPERVDLSAPQGGCYTIRASSGFALVRCQSFRNRPGQADGLHLDLWWRGRNMAIDSGTYSYNAPSPWDNAFSRTSSHNTVEVDGLDQMDRAGRFLWLPWMHGRVRSQRRSSTGLTAYWEGEHDGYLRLLEPVLHRRAVVLLGGEHWLVLDTLTSTARHAYRLHWLLPDLPYRANEDERTVTVQSPAGPYGVRLGLLVGSGNLSVVRAAAHSPRGWVSRHYMAREPAVSVAFTTSAETVRFWTVLGPPCRASTPAPNLVRIEHEGMRAEVCLSSPDSPYLVAWISLAGTYEDRLEF